VLLLLVQSVLLVPKAQPVTLVPPSYLLVSQKKFLLLAIPLLQVPVQVLRAQLPLILIVDLEKLMLVVQVQVKSLP
jgi:hypothetical protein